jgi:hypothetical protein
MTGWQKQPNFEKRVFNILEEHIKEVSFKVLRGVVIRTPVDTGRLRGNWQVGINSSPVGEKPGPFGNTQSPFPAAQTVISSGKSVIDKTNKQTKSVYIVNNLPYATAIENGHGAKNGPGVMVAATLAVLKLS